MNWRSIRRNVIAGVLTVWFGVGVITADGFHMIMPALNWKGQTYVGLTWPVAFVCHEALNDRCTVVPPMRYAKYLFTFDA
jgi:hypothetical protein